LQAQWFTLGMIGLLALAWLAPAAGEALAAGGRTRDGAIVLIFLLTGLVLPSEEVWGGLRRWRLHLYVQLFCFVLYPLVFWVALLPWRESLPGPLVIGFYLLAVLPTTISSCVVFTQISGGNTAGAIFNAVTGNLAGIVISPLLLALMIGAGGLEVGLDIGAIVLNLATIVLLPFALGQAGHWISGGRLAGWRKKVGVVNSLCVLSIVYFAFCQTFARPGSGGGAGVLLPLALLVPVHLAILGLAEAGSRLLRLPRADRIAAIYCAPQKTLALGLPLIAACLAAHPDWIGQASLPVIVYHPLQLFVAGLLKGRISAASRPVR
jgi:sodium/bile acid cotransporter 7